MRERNPVTTELSAAMRSFRGALLGVAAISAVVNVLYLTGSFYMLEIYDRVLPSRSMPTLIAISLLAGALYTFQGMLDFLRGRILISLGAALDQKISARVFDVLVRAPLQSRGRAEGLQPLRDLDQIRSFLSSGGPIALFDLPWLPFYLAICFLFHVWLGVTATIGAAILIAVTLSTDLLSRAPSRDAAQIGATRFGQAEASRRNAEVVHALGMAGRMNAIWRRTNDDYIASQQRLGDITTRFGALSKVLRMVLQSAVLGVGAILVMRQEASAGIIIAGSILSARALAPAELAIANWKGLVAARQGWRRLNDMLAALPPVAARVPLPAPATSVAVEGVTIVPPATTRPAVMDVQFALSAGQGLGVIGPSAAGKSSLARALVGIWRPVRGKVRLDGAAIDQWAPDALGPHIGYLPQDVELFAGTIAGNISRFQADASAEAIIAAAKAASVHDMILRLPEGYDTLVGDDGAGLSAGQRQRIGLARALFGDPFFVVLDEPNSNLDSEGDEALTRAIGGVRARGGVVVVVAHRPSALAAVDLLLLLVEGRQQAFGPKDIVLAKLARPTPNDAPTVGPRPRLISEGQGGAP